MTAGADIAANRIALVRAQANMSAVLVASGVGGREGLRLIGVEAVNEVKRMLSHPGSGRTYRRRTVTHRASAPGDPPAVDTGRLRASYTYNVEDDYVEVGTNVLYAPYLENGTSRMEPRPHLRPAIENLRTGKISGILAANVAKSQAQKAASLRAVGKVLGGLVK